MLIIKQHGGQMPFDLNSIIKIYREELNMSGVERKFLEITDLRKGYGSGETRQEVLRGLSFSVAKGEFCVLLGPSGSGKSTLLNIIGGIDNADSGYIAIHACNGGRYAVHAAVL